MATYKASATLFALTLAAVCSLTLAYCPETALNPDVCAEQYRKFEKAMLDNKNNLYKLHTEFFPPGYVSPAYGTIIYNIYVPCMSEPESGSGNGTLLEPTEMPNSVPCEELFKTVIKHWSSSLLLVHIEPLILSSFQLYALDLTFYYVEYALEDEEFHYPFFSPSYVDVMLKMMIDNDTDWNPKNTNATLDDITSRLKMYAVMQTSIDQWHGMDLEYKGYSVSDSDSVFVKVPVLLACIDVLFVLLLAIAFTDLSGKLYGKFDSKETTAGGRSYCFFWAFGFVAFFLNINILFYDIIQVHFLYRNFGSIEYKEIKMAITICTFRLSMSWAVILFIDLPIAIYNSTYNLVNFSIPNVLQVTVFFCQNCCCKFLNLKFVQILALWNIYAFLHLVSISALPLLLWLFIHPIRIFTMTVLLASTIFCVTAFTALLIKYLGNITIENYRENLCNLLHPLVVFLFLATVILTSLIYSKLITTGLEANSISGFLVTILPSVIIATIGWFISWKNNFNPQEKE